ncbi:MAG: endoribonuclease MazF [Armatimonadetes bacterium]|nr:endoribonuclease MazF [Armatimonadota bacterium]
MSYVPDRGDIVWLTFNPQAGHEQAGRRPALTLSPKIYNEKSGLALFCPITNQKKGYPFEVAVSEGDITGVVLTDQIRSLDWSARQAAFIQTAPDATLKAALQKARTLL